MIESEPPTAGPAGAPGDGPEPGTVAPPTWLADALQRSSDLVVVIDGATTITWISDAVRPMLGYLREEVLGRPFVEFVHPDDLGRAAEVVALTGAGAFDATPITPALYRVGRADGSWVSLEVNASLGPDLDGAMLLVARVGGDLVLTDRLLEAVTAQAPFEDQVELVMDMGRWRHPSDGYTILYRDSEGRRLTSASDLPPALTGAHDPEGPTPWGSVLGTGADVVVDDIEQVGEDDVALGPALAKEALAAGYVGCVAVPVADPMHEEGACIVIWTTAHGPSGSGHRYALENMRRALALVLQQRAQLGLLERAARVDHLTGVVTRARFFELLGRVERDAPADGSHALLFIDLDGFKAVNDTLGHRSGDHVLRTAAQRIAALLPERAVLGRLGGDEFAVLCPAGTSEDEATALAQSIVTSVRTPVDVDGERIDVGASVGVAVGEPGQGPQAVLDAADVALFEAKADGRGRWRSARTRG